MQPLARLGYNVLGIDASEGAVAAAQSHAQRDDALNNNLKYRCQTAGR